MVVDVPSVIMSMDVGPNPCRMLNQLSTPARRLHPMGVQNDLLPLRVASARWPVVGVGQTAAVTVDRRVIAGACPVGLESGGVARDQAAREFGHEAGLLERICGSRRRRADVRRNDRGGRPGQSCAAGPEFKAVYVPALNGGAVKQAGEKMGAFMQILL